jgi:hypothetical protein
MSGYVNFRQALRGCAIAACASATVMLLACPTQAQSTTRRDRGASQDANVSSLDMGDPGQSADATIRGGRVASIEATHTDGHHARIAHAPDRRIRGDEGEPVVSLDSSGTRTHMPALTVVHIPAPSSDGFRSADDNGLNGPPDDSSFGPPAGFPIGPPAGFPIGPPSGFPIGPPAGLTMPQVPDPPRVTTPIDPRRHRHPWRRPDYNSYTVGYDNGGYYNGGGYPAYYGNGTVIVPGNSTVIISGTTTYLGGYYYGFYTDSGNGDSYPSVYSLYTGFPQTISPPNIQIIQPVCPQYTAPPCDFHAPTDPVIYKEVIYYVETPKQAEDVEAGGEVAKKAIHTAGYPADSYQAAFGDIERAWTDGNLSFLHRHLRDKDSKISVYLGSKYAYSLSSGDFEQITRDAFDRLSTVSFKFNKLRKAENGVVTAYGRHVYQTEAAGEEPAAGQTVPFDSSGSGDNESSSPGVEKTVYVAYTLRHRGGLWYIISVTTSPTELGGDE